MRIFGGRAGSMPHALALRGANWATEFRAEQDSRLAADVWERVLRSV